MSGVSDTFDIISFLFNTIHLVIVSVSQSLAHRNLKDLIVAQSWLRKSFSTAVTSLPTGMRPITWISELWSGFTDCIPEPWDAETREQVLVSCPHDTENPYQAERSNRLAISTIHPQLSRSTGIETTKASSQTEERRSSYAHQTSLGASDFQAHSVKPEQVFAPDKWEDVESKSCGDSVQSGR